MPVLKMFEVKSRFSTGSRNDFEGRIRKRESIFCSLIRINIKVISFHKLLFVISFNNDIRSNLFGNWNSFWLWNLAEREGEKERKKMSNAKEKRAKNDRISNERKMSHEWKIIEIREKDRKKKENEIVSFQNKLLKNFHAKQGLEN